MKNGTLSVERVNDAVARIISVKLALGSAALVTSPALSAEPTPTNKPVHHATTEYEDSLTAVH